MFPEVGCNRIAETCCSGLLYMWMQYFKQFVGNKTYLCVSVALKMCNTILFVAAGWLAYLINRSCSAARPHAHWNSGGK